MCCLPCWPVRDVVLEETPEAPVFQYVWNGANWVPTISDGAQPGVATAGIPIVPPGTQPPMPGQPINVQPGFVPPMNCAGAPFPAAVPGFAQPTPPVTPPGTYFVSGAHGGYEMGKTKSEVDAENRRQALSNQMYEPQGIKPADDDISRMYWTRELDGHWIPRSRCSLDTSGNFRWYVTENGVFYAVILRD